MEKLEEAVVSVQNIGSVKDSENYSVCFGENSIEYSIIVPFPDVKKFKFGEKYDAVIETSGSPDFIGDDVEKQSVCTMSSRIVKITNRSGKVVYQIENSKK